MRALIVPLLCLIASIVDAAEYGHYDLKIGNRRNTM